MTDRDMGASSGGRGSPKSRAGMPSKAVSFSSSSSSGGGGSHAKPADVSAAGVGARSPYRTEDMNINLKSASLRKSNVNEVLPTGASGRYGGGVHHDDDKVTATTQLQFASQGHVSNLHPDPLDYADQLLLSHGSIMANSDLSRFDHKPDGHGEDNRVNVRGQVNQTFQTDTSTAAL